MIERLLVKDKTAAEVHQLRRRLCVSLEHALRAGFWWCDDCENITQPVESDHGQPTRCEHCGSHRISFERPALPSV